MLQHAIDVTDDSVTEPVGDLALNGAEDPVGDDPMPEDAEAIDLWAERRMWKIRQLVEQQQRNLTQAEELREPLVRRIDMIDNWLIEQNGSLQAQIEFLTRQVEQVALAYPYRDKKSRTMPAGTFGKRKVPEVLSVEDKAKAVAFSEAHEIPVRIKKEPDARALREYFDSTGTVPDGCIHVAEYERPYVKVED